MNLQSILLSSLIAGSILAAGCREAPEQSSAPRRSVPVQAFVADYQQVPTEIIVPGSIQARNRITIASQINGFVRDVAVRAGDAVASGQLLVTLDAREAENQKAAASAAIEEARAALEEARESFSMTESMRAAAKAHSDLAAATYERYQKLFAQKSASPQEIDEVRARRDAAAADLAAKENMVAAAKNRIPQIEARISQAEAQAARADVVLGWTALKSPKSARVVERMVDPGSAIFPGSPLMVLESVSGKQAVANLPSSQSRFLNIGLEVRIIDDAAGFENVVGRISEIVPGADPTTHAIQFKVDLAADFSAPAGRFVKIAVPAGSRDALLVSPRALRRKGQLTGVFVIDNASMARFRLVKTSTYGQDQIEILSGLEPGDSIIAEPSPEIVDGVAVEVRS